MTDKAMRLEEAREAIRRRDFSSAYSLYDALLADHPGDADVLLDYGRAKYAEYSDLEGAARLFEQALAASPQSVETLLWLGDLFSLGYGRGYDAAAEVYRKVIQLDPGAVDAYLGLGLLHRVPTRPVTLEEAIASFRTATELDPRRADAQLDLGMALIEASQPEEALTQLRKAQQLLAQGGQERQARGVEKLLAQLAANQPIKSFAYSNQSPRYR
jgi:tetratricopeptide (TPR) repeat protein